MSTVLSSEIISSEESFISTIMKALRNPQSKPNIINETAYYEAKTQNEKPKGKHWTMLGHCYFVAKEFDKSYSAYKKALYTFKEDTNPQLWYGIGLLYSKFGNYKYAEPAFLAVLRISPDFEEKAMVYYNLGSIFKVQLQYENAEFYFRKSSECTIADGELKSQVLSSLGFCLEQQNKGNAALKVYIQAANACKNQTNLSNVGNCYARLGDTENANSYFSQINDERKVPKESIPSDIAQPVSQGIQVYPYIISQMIYSWMPMLNMVNYMKTSQMTKSKPEDEAAEILSGLNQNLPAKRLSFDSSIGRKKKRID